MNQTFKIRVAEDKDFSPKVLQMLQEVAEVEMASCTAEELPEIFNSCDVFWFRLGFKLNKELIDNSTQLKIIATPVTGIDHIDEAACAAKGIKIICLRGEYEFLKEVRATAEHTLALTLALLRHLPAATLDAQQGNWQRDLYRGHELYKKKVGIIGMGRLGQITASYFKAFGCDVYYYDTRSITSEVAQPVKQLNDIAACDIISVHVNYTKENHHLIDSDFFEQCTGNGYFINTSRGGIVKEMDLLNALDKGLLKGAALDVIQDEFSYNASNTLATYAREHHNLLLTPHIGGNTYESFEKTELFIAQKIIAQLHAAGR
ncbi:MAG: NAD(P)-dependent oxidoreductase [Bacteroidia bacterium]